MKIANLRMNVPFLKVPFSLQIEKMREITLIEWLIMTAIHEIGTSDLPLIADQAGINKVEFLETVYNDLVRWDLLETQQPSLTKRGIKLYIKEKIPTDPRDDEINLYRNLWSDKWDKNTNFVFNSEFDSKCEFSEGDISISDNEIGPIYGLGKDEDITSHFPDESNIQAGFVKENFNLNLIKIEPWLEIISIKSKLNQSKKFKAQSNLEFKNNINNYTKMVIHSSLNSSEHIGILIERSKEVAIENVASEFEKFMNKPSLIIGYNLNKLNLESTEFDFDNFGGYFIDNLVQSGNVTVKFYPKNKNKLRKLNLDFSNTEIVIETDQHFPIQPGILRINDLSGFEFFTIPFDNEKGRNHILMGGRTSENYNQSVIQSFKDILVSSTEINDTQKKYIQYLFDPSKEPELLDILIDYPEPLSKLEIWIDITGNQPKTNDNFLENLDLSLEMIIVKQDLLRNNFSNQTIVKCMIEKFNNRNGVEDIELFLQDLKSLNNIFDSVFTSNEELLKLDEYNDFIGKYIQTIGENLTLENSNQLLSVKELLPNDIIRQLRLKLTIFTKKNIQALSRDEISDLIPILDFLEDEDSFVKIIQSQVTKQLDGWGDRVNIPDIIYDLKDSSMWMSIGRKTVLEKFSEAVFKKDQKIDDISNFIEDTCKIRQDIPALILYIRASALLKMTGKDIKPNDVRETLNILELLITSGIFLKTHAQEVLNKFTLNDLSIQENEQIIMKMGISEKQINNIKLNIRAKDLKNVIIYIDGPNVAREGSTEKNSEGALIGQIKKVEKLLKLLEKTYKIRHVKVVSSQAMEYWIDQPKRYKKLRKQKKIIEAPVGESDDRAALIRAYEKGAFLISNDKFKDWIEKDEKLTDFVKTSVVSFSLDLETYDFVLGENLQKLLGGLKI